MGDWLSFVGGVLFVVLGLMSFANRDLVWKLYNLERGWRKANPERTPAWDAHTRRYGYIFIVVGIFFMLFGLLV